MSNSNLKIKKDVCANAKYGVVSTQRVQLITNYCTLSCISV